MLCQMVLYRLARGPRNVQQEIDRGVGVDWRLHRLSFALMSRASLNIGPDCLCGHSNSRRSAMPYEQCRTAAAIGSG